MVKKIIFVILISITQNFLYPQNEKSTQINSLIIQSKNTSNSEFCFGTSSNFFSFILHSSLNDFSLSHNNYPIITITEQNQVNLFSKNLNLNNETYINGNLKIKGINQWKLIYEEIEEFEGWSNNKISFCGGIKMLGGYCIFSNIETEKIYNNIPEHNMIRIKANDHFIDNWNGESGYMKIGNNEEMNFIWTESYSAFEGNKGINICGGKMNEGKFSSPIDIIIPHKDNYIKIAFGSNLQMVLVMNLLEFQVFKFLLDN